MKRLLAGIALRIRARAATISARASRLLRLAPTWVRSHPRLTAVVLTALLAAALAAPALFRAPIDRDLTVVVRRGALKIRITETGVLRPARSITYRAPLSGREMEITFLVPEGTRVKEGDLLVRLDTSEIENEARRATQDLRQAQMDLRAVGVQRQEAETALESLVEGEASLSLEELMAQLRLAERKVERLTSEYQGLKPLLEKGYITGEELERSAFEMEQAQAELDLTRKKVRVYRERTFPRERERAELELAQRIALEEVMVPRVDEARKRLQNLSQALAGCEIRAERPGLVVYEELLTAQPRRKIRVSDRVTRSQGLVTIPEVGRMVVEASVDEASVHRVRKGQIAAIRLDAYPDLTLSGQVSRVGTLARSSIDRPFDEKRFDLVVDVDPNEHDLRPEMSARVDILVGERPNVLLVPLNAVFEREGMFVAYVVRLFSVEMRPLEVGESSELEVEIARGLSAGERVTLLPPPEGAVDAPSAAQGTSYVPSKSGGTLEPLAAR